MLYLCFFIYNYLYILKIPVKVYCFSGRFSLLLNRNISCLDYISLSQVFVLSLLRDRRKNCLYKYSIICKLYFIQRISIYQCNFLNPYYWYQPQNSSIEQAWQKKYLLVTFAYLHLRSWEHLVFVIKK